MHTVLQRFDSWSVGPSDDALFACGRVSPDSVSHFFASRVPTQSTSSPLSRHHTSDRDDYLEPP
ncbi:hypothetical protein K491DRAFT_694517 [Lophiostoma macrostomum CBS 122681]|uniref:Uncharacterized protein n=1 Tax=Lophiostoma macrostomum CBS 122681 TaxID=1314788 RepID=A0A6A6T574_9PLEO|nr:hypothetical protein K491DRAFT_694517 [Lophiostoma macrostomum CBS 122681]